MRQWDKSKRPTGPWTLNQDCPQAVGLISWFPMDGVGTPAAGLIDLGPQRFDLTAITAVTRTLASDGGPAGVYNGSSSLITRTGTNVGTIIPGFAGPCTVGVWANPNVVSSGPYGIFGCASDSFSDRFQFDIYTNSLRWVVINHSGTAGLATKSGAVVGKWQHFAGKEAASNSRYAYINGVPGSQDTTSITLTADSSNSYRNVVGALWAPSSYYYFSGQIGETCIWNIAVPDAILARVADPGLRFELWYPLRSRKWISSAPALPTLSNATYKAGTLTTVGFTPEVTAS